MPDDQAAGSVNDPAAFMEQYLKNRPAGTTAAQEPMVWWGGASTDRGPVMQQDRAPGSMLNIVTRTQTDAMSEFYRWDEDERAAWGKRLYGAGLIDDPNDFDAQLKGWQAAVQGSSDYYMNAGKKITPWAFMDLYARDRKGPKSLAGTKSSTDTNTFIPDKSDAEAAIKTLFKEQLGRAPEDGEIDRYTSMMLRKYRENPEVTKSTVTTDAEGNVVDRKSTTTGRFNPAGALEDKVQGDPEWGAYQAATTYYNALQQAIGAPG